MTTLVPALSNETIRSRLAEGFIPRWGPFVVLISRSFFILLFQGVTFLLLQQSGDPNPAVSVRHWFSVYGTLADLGCLALLFWLTRREGIRLLDLIGFVKSKLKTDILLGLGIFIVLFPLAMFAFGRLALLVTYGTLTPEFAEGTFIRTLPLWAVLYSRLLWWPLWSATEEMVYNGYALPRLVAMTKSTWLSVALVSFFYSIQHSFHSIATIEHAVYMFLIFIPLTVGMALVYLRVRRLTPLIIGHWLMDLANVLFMLQIA
jgi:hypothetical protein